MGAVQKVDSNVTGLRYQEETSIGVANSANSWLALEPNTYEDFGGEFTTVARNPINAGRQRQKGVLVDLDASGGFQSDLTQANMQDLLQGFFFADLRRKNDIGADRNNRRESVAPTGQFDDYLITDINTNVVMVDSIVANTAAVVAGGTGYAVDDIVELTNAAATVLQRWRVATEAGGVVATVDLAEPAVVVGGFRPREGRTDTSSGVGAVTTALTGSGDDGLTLTVTDQQGLTWQIGDIVLMAGHDDAANNGEFVATAASTNTFTIGAGLTNDAAINAAATATTVGFDFAAGDLDVVNAGGTSLPTLTTAAENFTTMGLIPGEWIFIGGDISGAAGNQFLGATNNGFARIHSIAAGVLTLDKTSGLTDMVTEASTAELIKIYFGRVLKNEADSTLQVRRTYNLERQLGAPDDSLPAEVQAEYLEGWTPNEITFNYGTADKIVVDVSGVAVDVSTIDGPTALKAGARPTLVSEDAYNTSNDIARLKLAILNRNGVANPTALFAFLTEFTINVNNNITPNKAISVLGAFDVTAGQFIVEGTMEAYFASVTAVTSIRNNDDITLDLAQVRGTTGAKVGTVIDIPLITLGDGRLNVAQDDSIKLPLDTPAGADRVFNHTLLMTFFDKLPDAADV